MQRIDKNKNTNTKGEIYRTKIETSQFENNDNISETFE